MYEEILNITSKENGPQDELRARFQKKKEQEEDNIYQSVIDAFLLNNPELLVFTKESE